MLYMVFIFLVKVAVVGAAVHFLTLIPKNEALNKVIIAVAILGVVLYALITFEAPLKRLLS